MSLRTEPGGRLSRDAVERLATKHAAAAAGSCPPVKEKNVTPHTLRHTAAMSLLRAGTDTSVIALWTGHERLRGRKKAQDQWNAVVKLRPKFFAQWTWTTAVPRVW